VEDCGANAGRTLRLGGVRYLPDGRSGRPRGNGVAVPEDLLDTIQRELSARLRELEGAVAEYEQLRIAAQAFGSAPARPAAASSGRAPARTGRARRAQAARKSAAVRRPAPARPAASARRAATSGRSSRASSRTRRPAGRTASGAPRKRAPRGANRDAILAAVRRRGGGAVASELARTAGVGRVSAYQVLGRLEGEGLVRKVERPGAPTLYVAA
jgi:hypothetical protein